MSLVQHLDELLPGPGGLQGRRDVGDPGLLEVGLVVDQGRHVGVVRDTGRRTVDQDRGPQGREERAGERVVEVVGEVGQGAVVRVTADVGVGDAEQVGGLVGLEPAVDDGADLVVRQHLDLHLGAARGLEVGGDLLEGDQFLIAGPGGQGDGAASGRRCWLPSSIPPRNRAPGRPHSRSSTSPAPARPVVRRNMRRFKVVMTTLPS